jgi:hypothetical protein
LINSFGETLFNIYFEPYNEKIWKTPLKDVPLDWLDGKLPMPNISDILTSNILRKGESNMVHSNFYYAKEGGSQFIVDKLSERLEFVHKGVHVNEIVKCGAKWSINGQLFDFVVYTGDVRRLESICNGIEIDRDLIKDLSSLKSNGTSNVLCEIDKNDISWLYIPSREVLPHRIIYTGNFSSNNNGQKERTTCTIEFSGKVSENIIREEIKKLPGNPTPLAFNYEENSYVIHSKNTKINIDRLKSQLMDSNFYLLGRFAEWEYYNMDKAIEAAMELTEEIVNISKLHFKEI